MQEMDRILSGMMTKMDSMHTLKFVAFIVNNLLVRLYHQGIHIKESEFLEVKKCAQIAEKEKVSMIFLPNHKSHVDYLVISYVFYRLGIALPHIAGIFQRNS
jgi:glycerol-3-phosphate O-acyltransferase